MKILVTGLCLSRNLGGSAMALTFANEVKNRFPEVDFIFAISATDYDQERRWADFYGFDIVRRDTLPVFVANKLRLRRIYGVLSGRFSDRRDRGSPDIRYWSEVHKEFIEAYKESDLVVDMSGISYVGDGVRHWTEGVSSFTPFCYAWLLKRPFLRFIQSFGPFRDWKVRLFARIEFNKLDFIPARGNESARYCREIVRDKDQVFDFPDCAILLPQADETWLSGYLERKGLRRQDYVVLSPSAVVHNMPPREGASLGEGHIETFTRIASTLVGCKIDLLFLPHMYSERVNECDREVCLRIVKELGQRNIGMPHIRVVTEDINPMEAKALIAHSKFAIVSRYHALVASVSTGTPVVAIGWNVKYSDLMQYYGVENMAFDARDNDVERLVQRVFELVDNWNLDQIRTLLNDRQKENSIKVKDAFGMLYDWIVRNAQ